MPQADTTVIDDRLAKRNVAILAYAQAVLGSQMGIQIILGGLAALSVLVFWTHRENLGRLLKGTEPRFGTKKKDAPEA